MGASYSVDLVVSLKDEKKAAEILQEFMRVSHAEFNIDQFAAIGVYNRTFDDLLRIILAGWESTPVKIEQIDDYRKYSNDFDASYGLESVVIEAFEALVPVLEDGSILDLSADDVYTGFVVTDGKLVQKE